MIDILVAEDEELERNALLSLLESPAAVAVFGEPLRIIMAVNGLEAIRLYDNALAQGHTLSGALLDIRMPGMNGFETAKALRQRDPEIPIVFLTACGDFDSAREAIRAGAGEYLLKPAQDEEILAALASFIPGNQSKRGNSPDSQIFRTTADMVQAEKPGTWNVIREEPLSSTIEYLKRRISTSLNEDKPDWKALQEYLRLSSPARFSGSADTSGSASADAGPEGGTGAGGREKGGRPYDYCALAVFSSPHPGPGLRSGTGNARSIATLLDKIMNEGISDTSPSTTTRGVCQIFSAGNSERASLLVLQPALQSGKGIGNESGRSTKNEFSCLYDMIESLRQKISRLSGSLVFAGAVWPVKADDGTTLTPVLEACALATRETPTVILSRAIPDIRSGIPREQGYPAAIGKVDTLPPDPSLYGTVPPLTPGPGHATVMKALTVMRVHMQEDLSLDSVAAVLKISPSHLSRLLARYRGAGFSETFATIRVGRARELLASGHSVKETGALVGFKDPAYFARVFRKLAGLSPVEFKESLETDSSDRERLQDQD